MHPLSCDDNWTHAEIEDFVLDDEGGPPDFLYVAFPTAVESDRLPDLKGLLPGNEFMGWSDDAAALLLAAGWAPGCGPAAGSSSFSRR